MMYATADRCPDFVAFEVLDPSGRRKVTAPQFATQVTAVAKGLIATGIEAGDRVAIMAGTSFEWVLLDYAIWAAGACTVAIYESSSADQAGWILADSGAKLLVVENGEHYATVARRPQRTPDLAETLRLDSDAVRELTARGAQIDDGVVAWRCGQVGPADPATLIYTSGTTGRPKGVALTHANLLSESGAGRRALSAMYSPGQRTLLFLPLAHVYARSISVGAFEAAVTVGHSADWSTLPQQFAAFRPDFVLAVPRVFEKIFHGAEQRAHDSGRGRLFDRAVAIAVARSEAEDTGRSDLLLRLEHRLYEILVYRRLRSALGGRCRAAISGGGPLDVRLNHFFRGIGMPIFEGYGLTETTSGITINTIEHTRIGSVGRPLAGHQVTTAPDGELLVSGPVVFAGYWNNPDPSSDVLTPDGWFRTGDLGAIDADGFVWITGRKKEILVTAAGKNVSPAPLEQSVNSHPLVSQCMVVGDGKPFVGALITLDAQALPGWLERHALSADLAVAELVDHPVLRSEIDSAVARANALVSRAEAIKKFRILTSDWTLEAGELTPKMSLKRNVVTQKYAGEIDALYA
ncbi:AMP-dependent synthetase/ligase [Nocardia nova]|uniref:AMP-dependent synthetase/ligase n=1 Tax=Nocardia nova TaxID=37330 RepID=UPI0033EADBB7